MFRAFDIYFMIELLCIHIDGSLIFEPFDVMFVHEMDHINFVGQYQSSDADKY